MDFTKCLKRTIVGNILINISRSNIFLTCRCLKYFTKIVMLLLAAVGINWLKDLCWGIIGPNKTKNFWSNISHNFAFF